ncbi:lantibiotic dehydratase [Pseudoalteromonas rubra]|uniref:Lantibiotic dehydratase N-terminal domain-containing protein n=1 Tax=Pseudoalteromonas rubra TaxID=43658 RepID=A0A0F4QUU0_9GAMM|nr:lantibiotic dehydratase [Pseudoalteromonas rubra]KJZ11433.1 hypothetical protein TW77_06040 [Pseudoalteromonas rubra]
MNQNINIEKLHTSHQDLAGIDVAEFALLRMATIPFCALKKLQISGLETQLDRVLSAQKTMEVEAKILSDKLHELVSTIPEDEKVMRRTVINLRRDIHNQRTTKVKREQVESLSTLLGANIWAKLQGWFDAQMEVKLIPEYERQLQSQLQTSVRPALREALKYKEFNRALAFASSGVAREALSEKKLPKTSRPNNLERSLLGYLNRSAAKTSPFSSFMALATLPIDLTVEGTPIYGEKRKFDSHITYNRGAVARYFRTDIVNNLANHYLTLRVNPTLQDSIGGRMQSLCDREVVLLGRPWLEQRLAQFRLNGQVVSVLKEHAQEDTFDGWLQAFVQVGIEEKAAKDLLQKLFERDILQVQHIIDAYTLEPLKHLLSHWSSSTQANYGKAVPALEALIEQLSRLKVASAKERLTIFETISELDQALLVEISPNHELDRLQNLVLEDCWFDGVKGTLGSNLLSGLADLNQFLKEQIIVSPYYDRMCKHFIERFGVDGVCHDVVGFLLAVGDKLIDIPEFGNKFEVPEARKPLPHARLPVTAQIQVAKCKQTNQAKLIVNRVFEGAGWLAARFTAGNHAGQVELTSKLRDWLDTLNPDGEPVDCVLSGHCNDLQAHARLTERVLQWPGESLQLPAEQIIDVADISMSYDEQTQALQLFDNTKKRINLVYLGATYPSPIWGIRYALSILTQPYLLHRPDFRPPTLDKEQATHYEPRMEQGDLVLRRATWWISADYIKEHWFAQDSLFERILNVKKDRERLRLPRYVFAQRYVPPERTGLVPSDALDPSRKPIWIDLGCPFWLNMLTRLVEKSDWLSFTEPFPNDEELWLEVDGEQHVSELQLEMILNTTDFEQKEKGNV